VPKNFECADLLAAESWRVGEVGNSIEDLRNSLRGYTLGQMVAGRRLETAGDVASWLSENAR